MERWQSCVGTLLLDLVTRNATTPDFIVYPSRLSFSVFKPGR